MDCSPFFRGKSATCQPAYLPQQPKHPQLTEGYNFESPIPSCFEPPHSVAYAKLICIATVSSVLYGGCFGHKSFSFAAIDLILVLQKSPRCALLSRRTQLRIFVIAPIPRPSHAAPKQTNYCLPSSCCNLSCEEKAQGYCWGVGGRPAAHASPQPPSRPST